LQAFKIMGCWQNAKVDDPATIFFGGGNYMGKEDQPVPQAPGMIR